MSCNGDSSSPSSPADNDRKPCIKLFRFESGDDDHVPVTGDHDESSSNNDLFAGADSSSPPKYRRLNCGACVECLSDDCLSCRVCVSSQNTSKRRRRCARKVCRRPVLPNHAVCHLCRSKTPTASMKDAHSSRHLDLAECGLCCKVVHPACVIRKYNLAPDVQCVFYPKLLNAWDCFLCSLGIKTTSSASENLAASEGSSPPIAPLSPAPLSSAPCVSSTDNDVKCNTMKTRTDLPKVTTTASTTTTSTTTISATISSSTSSRNLDISIEEFNLKPLKILLGSRVSLTNLLSPEKRRPKERICELCGGRDLDEYLMTCTSCARIVHDVCDYARRFDDTRFAGLGGVRNCLDPRYWECPLCLLSRGVRKDNWRKAAMFDGEIKTRIVKERSVDMFSPHTGNVVVSHFSINDEVISHTPSDVATPEVISFSHNGVENSAGGAVPSMIVTQGAEPDECTLPDSVPSAMVRCDVCHSTKFSSQEELNSHVTSQHPKCAHCTRGGPFRDIPDILAHFRSEHLYLKRCKMLIANETLVLAMNASFHG